MIRRSSAHAGSRPAAPRSIRLQSTGAPSTMFSMASSMASFTTHLLRQTFERSGYGHACGIGRTASEHDGKVLIAVSELDAADDCFLVLFAETFQGGVVERRSFPAEHGVERRRPFVLQVVRQTGLR